MPADFLMTAGSPEINAVSEKIIANSEAAGKYFPMGFTE
jgi:hypothetical protein